MHSRVAIILLNYNNSRETLSCISLLKKIDYPDFKIFVIDNASKYNDYENLRNDLPSNIMLVRNEKNLGFAGGVNIGIKAALSFCPSFFLLLNTDIALNKQFLKLLVDALSLRTEFGLAGPVIYNYYERHEVSSAGIALRWHTFIFPHSLKYSGHTPHLPITITEVEALEGCALLIKSEVIQQIDLLDDNYFFECEDVDYCLKARLNGYKCILVPSSRIWHKGGGSSYRKGYSIQVLYHITLGRLTIAKKFYGKPEMLRLSLLFIFSIMIKLICGKPTYASFQLRAIINAWTGCKSIVTFGT